jgi:hypothetical protein
LHLLDHSRRRLDFQLKASQCATPTLRPPKKEKNVKTFAAAAARYLKSLKLELSIRSDGDRHSVIRTSWWLFEAVVYTSANIEQCKAFMAGIDRIAAEIDIWTKYTRELVALRDKLLKLI